MQTDLIAIACGLLAGFGWGFSGFFDAKASRAVGPLVASLLINGIVAVGFALMYVLFFAQARPLSGEGVAFAVASGVVITLGALSYFRGLALGPVSLVSPLSAAYPLVTTVIALVLFQAHITPPQAVAIYMIMFGVMAASGLLSVRDISTRKLQRGPLLGLGAALFWGMGYALAAQAITRLGWELASLIEFAAMAVAFGIFIPFIKTSNAVTVQSIGQGMKNKFILLAGSISLFAAVALNIGLSHEGSSGAIVAALSACYPVLTVLLAHRSFNEKVAALPLVGAFVSIVGVVLLSLTAQ